ncbi:MAG: DUF4143 domain-containing protein [bacterium]
MIERILKIDLPMDRSAFLWGPRKTGKTTLLKHQFPEALFLDLLNYDLYLALSREPMQLRRILDAEQNHTVIIDEVQKVPHLMDEIHWLIENRPYRFILSGSSARKFRRGQVNLLGGRAWRYELYPLVSAELGSFDLEKTLLSGFLPLHYLSSDSLMDLKAYVHDYLKEEIQAEALTRNLPAFSRFLQSAALTSGMLLNYSNAARDSGVSVKTIREYYQILEDTLIGRLLEPWKRSKSRRLIETSKFYFFDTGIVAALLDYRTLNPGTKEFGRLFEHFIIQECFAYRHYSRKDFPISFWRTANGSEVDLILGDAQVALEIKSGKQASSLKPNGLRLFAQEYKLTKKIIVSRDPFPQKLSSGITILPWQNFCEQLWGGDLI